jgi:hypothetical protein
MSNRLWAAAAPSLLLALAAGGNPAHSAALDSGIYGAYTPSKNSVQLTVCGILPGSDGCYGGASLGPFENACAVLEGKPSTNGDVVSRAIYVLDKRSSKTAPIILYVYGRSDTITLSDDTVAVKLVKQVPLGILGGPGSKCSMAGNKEAVFAGTDVGGVVEVGKAHFWIKDLGNSEENPASITASDSGYVSIQYTDGQFLVLSPTQYGGGDGGGTEEFAGSTNALKF